MKKQKVKIQEAKNPESKFSLTAQDFHFHCSQYLNVISTSAEGSKKIKEYRDLLFEHYFTYKFFCREFNWAPTGEIKSMDPAIFKQLQDKFSETAFGKSDHHTTKSLLEFFLKN